MSETWGLNGYYRQPFQRERPLVRQLFLWMGPDCENYSGETSFTCSERLPTVF